MSVDAMVLPAPLSPLQMMAWFVAAPSAFHNAS